MKKYKLNSEEALREIINYMLREYSVDYDYVVKNPIINGISWFNYYWDTNESKQEFRNWLKTFIKTKIDYKPYAINKIIDSIDLNYGLTVKK